ncbi:N-acetyltransferase [Undibacterium piscinae]|jgi:L-amino acid N-acyltransferase YncA|uniref:N-acetyltransferase n=1 Tax=Undibacterium piscinae TaxID=2495591 RepID=A0A6M4A6V6_9BURK|nr:N-acetyltransferase [Undibacterium piscinae]
MQNIRAAEPGDATAICDIYNHYVDNTNISFEEIAVTSAEMAQRIIGVTENFPWLVIEVDGVISGYAYATKWRARSAYRFSVEVSVYLSPLMIGKGCGSQLYECLLESLEPFGVHVIIAGIALPNEPSVKLHEKMGFRKVAHFEKVGYKNKQWIDVAYWQKTLNNF